MPIIAESDPSGPVTGTDSAVRVDRPPVEVIFDGSLRRESAEVPGRESSSSSLGAAIRARQAAAPPEAEFAPVVEEQPAPDGDATPGADAEGTAAAAAKDAPAAEAKPEPEKPAEKPPEPQGAVELDVARQEAAVLRSRLQARDTSAIATERAAYLANPVKAIREYQARLFGVRPDDKALDEEQSHLQSELTYAAIGADTLPDDRKWQRHQEHEGRVKRLQQLAPPDTSGNEQTAQVVAFVSSQIKGTEAEFPFLGLAADLDGIDPAQAALEIWTAEVRAGRTKPGANDTESAREALRLANVHYQTRADRLKRYGSPTTAPPSTSAPAQASAQVAAPGAPQQQKPTTPAKAGSASSTALSAKQAATAPRVKAEKPDDGRIVIDPSDKDAERQRRIDIVRRRRPA